MCQIQTTDCVQNATGVDRTLFTVVFPDIRALLGPNLGKLQLLPDSTFWGGLTVVLFAIVLLLLARKLDSLEK